MDILIATAKLDLQQDVSRKYGSEQSTGLHYAIRYGNLDDIKYFVQHGADVNVRDLYGRTPLYYGIRNRNVECIQYLIDQGADFTDVTLLDSKIPSDMEEYLNSLIDIKEPGED